MSIIRNFLKKVGTSPAPIVLLNYSEKTPEISIYPIDFTKSNSSTGLTDIHYGYGELSAKISESSFTINCDTIFKNHDLGRTSISLMLYAYAESISSCYIPIIGPGGSNDTIYLSNGITVINLDSGNTTLSIVATGANTNNNYIYFKVWPYSGEFAYPTFKYVDSNNDRLIYGSGWSIVTQYVPKVTNSILHADAYDYITGEALADKTFNITNDGNTITIKNGSSTTTVTTTELICNSREMLTSSGELVPLNKDNTPLLYKNLTLGKDGCFGLSKFVLINRDVPIDDLKSIYDRMFNPPLPDVYYDIDKQKLTQPNIFTTTQYLIDLSGNENHGVINNLARVESEWVTNVWECIGASGYAQMIRNKLFLIRAVKANPVFTCSLSNIQCLSGKWGIYVSLPEGYNSSEKCKVCLYSPSDNQSYMEMELKYNTTNVWDLTGVNTRNLSSTVTEARFNVPDTWVNSRDLDCYIVFFPVYDDSKRVGYPQLGMPVFTEWDTSDVEILDYMRIDTNVSRKFGAKYPLDVEKISGMLVIPPIKGRFKSNIGRQISPEIRIQYYDSNGDPLGFTFKVSVPETTEYFDEQGYNISTIDFPGLLVNVKDVNFASFDAFLYFMRQGPIYEQLGYDPSFKFPKLPGNGYTEVTIPYGPNYQTVIMELVVSDDINEYVNTVNFYKCQDEATSDNVNLQMNGPATSAMGTELAFSKNNSGKVYINGVLNTTHTMSDYFNKHITVAIVGTNADTSSSQKWLGANNGGESPFKLYKFMAFQQQLTEEQLNGVYERYNFYMGN